MAPHSSAMLCTSSRTFSVLSLMTDTLPATSWMVADSCSAKVERVAALPLDAWVRFRTSPVRLLMRPELSWIVFKMLLMGSTTYLVISFKSAKTSRIQAATAAMPTSRDRTYTADRRDLAWDVWSLMESFSIWISVSIALA